MPPPPPKKRTHHRSYVPPVSYPSTTRCKPTQTIRDAFLSYDEQWDILIAPNDGNKLTFFSVPWPQFPRPSSVEEINAQMIRKFLACSGISMKLIVRKALLRFHPDKIANLIANVEDEYKEDVSGGCVAVARCLNEIKSSL
ncbi:hypothetical protein BU17DRAFT_45390 [Hysterangium stoloniferum]|nr:hypothetical protein BU17DRAFT_45390 [Hysterangium stoloniferum]